eukprot:scpid51969/ scgid27044/ 
MVKQRWSQWCSQLLRSVLGRGGDASHTIDYRCSDSSPNTPSLPQQRITSLSGLKYFVLENQTLAPYLLVKLHRCVIILLMLEARKILHLIARHPHTNSTDEKPRL